jgi:hypothetical protein
VILGPVDAAEHLCAHCILLDMSSVRAGLSRAGHARSLMEGLKGTAIRSAVRDPSCPQAPVFGVARRGSGRGEGLLLAGGSGHDQLYPGTDSDLRRYPVRAGPLPSRARHDQKMAASPPLTPMEGCRARAGGRAAQRYGTGPSSQSVAVTAGRRAQVKVPGGRTREATLGLEPLPAPRAGSKGQARGLPFPARGASGDPVPGATDDRPDGRDQSSGCIIGSPLAPAAHRCRTPDLVLKVMPLVYGAGSRHRRHPRGSAGLHQALQTAERARRDPKTSRPAILSKGSSARGGSGGDLLMCPLGAGLRSWRMLEVIKHPSPPGKGGPR